MTDFTPCPERDDLERLLLGRVPEAQAEVLEGHLSACGRCLQTARTLRAEDPLVAAIRAGARATDVPAGEADEALIALLDCLPQVVGREEWAGPTPALAGTDTPRPAEPHSGEEVYGVLAPPQGPAEIGRLGGYSVRKVLGAGGMGVVFLAEDVSLRRPVALKVMRPALAASASARERFVREARAAAAVRHDHVVTIYQVGEDRGVPFLAMERLEGESLDECLRRPGRLPTPDVLRVGRQIALGLAAAHERGLIHRDIKPANLWLEAGSGRVKILDFGLARAAEPDAHLTGSGVIVGTPAYIAPEQARGEPVDHRADLFSLGCVLYRLCTGKLPFRGKDPTSLLLSLAQDTPRPVRTLNPAVPPALAELVMQLLSKAAEGRPASAAAVADRLQALEAQPAAPATTEMTPTQLQPVALPGLRPSPDRGRYGRWLAAAVVLLALAPLGYFYGGVVVRFATNRGQVVIEVDDPDVEVTIKEHGADIVDPRGQRRITLAAGGHELEVTVKEPTGTIHVFTKASQLRRGGKQVISVRQELARAPEPAGKTAAAGAPPGVASADAERRAAEWVLSVGGKVTIRMANSGRWIHVDKDLPAGAFHVLHVSVKCYNPQVSDAGLAQLQALPNLERLILEGPQLTDAGLAHLRALPMLGFLALEETRVGDAGIEHLKQLPGLTDLALRGSRASDAGLAHLKSLPILRGLDLTQTLVSDAGMATLGAMPNLKGLSLGSTRVSDIGLAHLTALKDLRTLGLGGTRVTDAGLARLKSLTNLTALDLRGTRLTDAGLEHLGTLSNLDTIHLEGTGATDTGLARLSGLRNLVVLGLGGTRVTDAGLVHLKPLTRLAALELDETQVRDAGLEHLAALTSLWDLRLNATRVSDAGLVHLLGIRGLTQLELNRTRVSAAGIDAYRVACPKVKLSWWEPNRTAAEAVLGLGGTIHVRRKGQAQEQLVKAMGDLPREYFHLTRASLAGVRQPFYPLRDLAALTDPEFDQFRELDLSGTAITEAHLEGLESLPDLRRLVLDGTPVRDPWLIHLKTLPRMTQLSVGCPTLTDLGASVVGQLKGLERLSMASSAINDIGLEPLKGLKGLQELNLSGTKVTDGGIADLQKALPKCRILSGPAGKK
jgi:Leucine-rich repeat (LRR) protein